ncbi:MAG: cytidine deaminase [Planctomycetota bacterium]
MPTSNDVSEQQWQTLVEQAIAARANAYAPYSKFHVGAALLAADGRVFTGVNVENSSYGLTICAERTAACTAVAAGVADFVAIVVASENGVSPCGACRQFLYEWGGELLLRFVGADGHPSDVTTLGELLPGGFVLDDRQDGDR